VRFCAAFRIVRRLKYDGGGIEWKAGTYDIIAVAVIFIFYIQFHISFFTTAATVKKQIKLKLVVWKHWRFHDNYAWICVACPVYFRLLWPWPRTKTSLRRGRNPRGFNGHITFLALIMLSSATIIRKWSGLARISRRMVLELRSMRGSELATDRRDGRLGGRGIDGRVLGRTGGDLLGVS